MVGSAALRAAQVHLDFVGPWSPADQRLVEELRLAEQVTIVPFSPRREAVITSYSIHYTKLYESWPMIRKPATAVVIRPTRA